MKNALRILQVFPIITKLKTMRQFYFFYVEICGKVRAMMVREGICFRPLSYISQNAESSRFTETSARQGAGQALGYHFKSCLSE